ncbi:MttB family protein [Asticcacaulis sp. AC402]|nr:MttB family protein [Asticcacaulis sp. AC402]
MTDPDTLPQIVEDKHKRSLVTQGAAPKAFDDDEIEASRAPLMDHLVELRTRIVIMAVAFLIACIGCFAVAKPIYEFLLHPLKVASAMLEQTKINGHGGNPFDMMYVLLGLKQVTLNKDLSLIFTAPLEFIFTQMKMAMFGGIIVSFPILAWQLYGFVAPGLYRRERNAFLPFLFAAPMMFVLGMALVYFIILPTVLWFSLSQQIVAPGVAITAMYKVSDYLSLITTLMLAFGCCFQLPIVITLLGLTGILTSKMLRSFRRYAILAIVVVAAVVTPPDPISQLLLAIPIILLYEVSIICVKLIEWRRKDKPVATDTEVEA